jgi:hypothetical protein
MPLLCVAALAPPAALPLLCLAVGSERGDLLLVVCCRRERIPATIPPAVIESASATMLVLLVTTLLATMPLVHMGGERRSGEAAPLSDACQVSDTSRDDTGAERWKERERQWRMRPERDETDK